MRLLSYNRFPAKQLPHNLLPLLLVSSAFFMLPIAVFVLAYIGYLYFTEAVDTNLYLLLLQTLGLTIVWMFANTLTIWIPAAIGRWVQTLFIPNRNRIEPLTMLGDIRALFNPGPGGLRGIARHRLPPNFFGLMFWNMLIGEAVLALPFMLVYRMQYGIINKTHLKHGILAMVVVTLGVTVISLFVTGLGNSIGRWFFGSNEGTPGDYMVSYGTDDIEHIR